MVTTEVRVRGRKKIYYRAVSVREVKTIRKRRVYLGSDLDEGDLQAAELRADEELDPLAHLLDAYDLKRLERVRRSYQRSPPSTFRNRYETFMTSLTHDSTAIEGNTLTLRETGSLLFEAITPSFKPLKDINEVLNHRDALDILLSTKSDVSKDLTMKLHSIIMKGTLEKEMEGQLGRYRTVQVHIRDTDWMPPSPKDVPKDIATLLRWYSRNKNRLHPVIVASYFHIGFELVHPFVDGNGRVGRLLLNHILHRNGFPMVNIPNSRKNGYYEHLETGQVKGDIGPFVSFMIELMERNKVML